MATRKPAQPSVDGRTDLRGFDREGLAAFLAGRVDATPGDADRIFKQLWQRRADDDGARRFGAERVAALVGTRRELRAELEEVATVSRLELDREIASADGTRKFLWRLHDGHVIESVLIPDADRDGPDRLTLCMSTQVGCAMACTFCVTGDLGLLRHLSVAEIALQPLEVSRHLRPGQRITNLVLMGMGEPLHNLANLVPALRICLDDHGLGFSHRRVTVSTVGLVPKMAELAAALPVNLAVSLNAATEEQRRAIMPITKRHSMAELLDACRAFPLPTGKRITFEYVMLAGHNDALEDADRLAELLRDIPAKVNLIPYNENPDRPHLRRPDAAHVAAFRARLTASGVSTTVRATRGIDISAACGQLGKAAGDAGGRSKAAAR